MSLSSISVIKKISLILSRKAYIVYTDNPVPSLLIPLPSVDSSLKSAIYKTFSDLTNDQILTFHNKEMAQKDLNNIDRQHKARLNIQELDFPHQITFDSIEGVQVKPQSVFLTVNQSDHSLSFMQYKDLQQKMLNMEGTKKYDESREQHRQGQNQTKNSQREDIYRQHQNKQDDEKIKQPKKTKQQVSAWNGEVLQTTVKPQDHPKGDISSLNQHKFVPLAFLTDNIASKPIQIIYIQTSRQYLFLQFLKLFCLANIMCVYGLVRRATRSENHDEIRKKL